MCGYNILRVEGSPTAENLYSTVNELKALPKEKLVSFTSDGASVMQSRGRGVAGHLRRTINPTSSFSIAVSIVKSKMAFLSFLAMFTMQLINSFEVVMYVTISNEVHDYHTLVS